MQNKFCKNCGQANFPDAGTCTKCGKSLEQNTGNQFQVPVQQDQPANQPQPPKKSNTKYFVIGALAIVLLLFIGIVAIAGIAGAIYYSTSQEDKVVREYPDKNTADKSDDAKKGNDDINSGKSEDEDDDNPLSDIKFPPTGTSDDGIDQTKKNGKISNKILIGYFENQKQKVGSFSLKNVREDEDNRNFPNNTAGVRARYAKGSTSLTHEFAAYTSMADLRGDFADYKRTVKNAGSKVKTEKPTTIIYIKGPLVYLAFYNPQGGFHIISSRLGKDILSYHDAYFGKG